MRAPGAWTIVDEDGNMVPFKWNGLPGWIVCHCNICLPTNRRTEMKQKRHKYVFAGLLNDEQLEREKFLNTREGGGTAGWNMGLETSTYNFATGIWTSLDGNLKYKKGERVE